MSFLNVKWAVSLLVFARSFRRRMVDDGFDYRSLSGEPFRVTGPGPAGPGPVGPGLTGGRSSRLRRGRYAGRAAAPEMSSPAAVICWSVFAVISV